MTAGQIVCRIKQQKVNLFRSYNSQKKWSFLEKSVSILLSPNYNLEDVTQTATIFQCILLCSSWKKVQLETPPLFIMFIHNTYCVLNKNFAFLPQEFCTYDGKKPLYYPVAYSTLNDTFVYHLFKRIFALTLS